MHMNVINLLAAVAVAIHYQAIAVLSYAELGGDARGDHE